MTKENKALFSPSPSPMLAELFNHIAYLQMLMPGAGILEIKNEAEKYMKIKYGKLSKYLQ